MASKEVPDSDHNNGVTGVLNGDSVLEENDVFEVKMRKSRHAMSAKNKRISTASTISSSLLNLNSLPYSGSTLSLSRSSLFPTLGKRKDSISMSLTRDGETNVKITGYLDKRSKMLGWKTLYFVLDGRLLTYYKSKSDYDSLSACCGSINLGIASTVRPIQIRGCKGFPLQIVTRSQVYYLRSPNKQILEQWLLAIQEAASSQPLTISSPVWVDPGTQFFRYSFAASSEWSIASSVDDITDSLSKLPPNFYLKGGPHSSKISHRLQKCQSLASLQSPSSYSDSTMSSSRSKNSSTKKKGSKEAEDAPISGKDKPKFSALKEELTRKLSVGKCEGDDSNVKPSLTKPKSKSRSELPFLLNPNQGENHHYDEIVDFEAMYENCESGSDNSDGSKNSVEIDSEIVTELIEPQDNGIYEIVDASNEGKDECNNRSSFSNKVKNLRNSDGRLSSGGSSRKSNHSTKSEGNPKRCTEFQPAEWDRALSFSNQSTLNKKVQELEDSRKYSMESESSCSTINESKENVSDKSKKRKGKSLGTFFQRMFNRGDKSKKQKEKQVVIPESNLVITGPIDLRSKYKDSPVNRATNLPLDEARQTTLVRNDSKKITPVGGRSPDPNSNNVIDELKLKVERVHTLPLTPLADHILSKVTQKDDGSEEKPSGALKSKPQVPQKPQISKKPHNSGTEEQEVLTTDPVVFRKKHSDDFQEKLAKFNRLSARLSSTFVAALTPPQQQVEKEGKLGRSKSFRFIKPKKETLPPLPPKQKSNSPSEIFYDFPSNNRPVPPVKKVKGLSKKDRTEADSNGSKLAEAETAEPKEEQSPQFLQLSEFAEQTEGNVVSELRKLHKKNSAPDIFLSGSPLSELSGESEDRVDNVFEEILSPPPLPPKLSSSLKSGGQDSQEQATDHEYLVPTSIKSVEEVKSDKTKEGSSHTYENGPVEIHSKIGSSKASSEPSPPENKNPDARVYQNLKFATEHTLVQEYETVEEAEDEISELYDDFPSEYSGGSHTYETISPLPHHTDAEDKNANYPIRHSGIDELRSFLASEVSSSAEEPQYSEAYHSHRVGGAVNRLGHSSAVNQLKTAVDNSRSSKP